MELDECVYGTKGRGREISDRRSSTLRYALRNSQRSPPDRPVDECSRWNTSRVKGLQKAAAVDWNKRLKMFWLKNIKTERVRSTYYVIIIQSCTEGSLGRGERGKVEVHTHTHMIIL